MKDKNEKVSGQKERDDATMNFVTRQAQEAILNPKLPVSYKDEIVGAAVGTILRIAERKNAYNKRQKEHRRLKQSHIIYEAQEDTENEEANTPPIIRELNENLRKGSPKHSLSVERISERAGISRNILYEWVESDSDFISSLERLKEAQKNDPFKTGTEEDTFVNSMMVALLLLETKDRHYKAGNS